ncbi:MAG TPA: alpha/beta hydrolase [Chloroflexota bacterium]|nr:alpha/beta hydrolase [Chloroflexota bacterium]
MPTQANGEPFAVEVQDVKYQVQDGKAWLARLYRPLGEGPFPAIVDVHGGAWHNGDRMNNVGIDEALAARGILVAALDFHQPPEAGYPASIADVNLGIRWLKAHAADFHGAPAVGAFGNSSGGHQVVLSALRPRDPRYASLPLEEGPEVDATLAYVIAGWPVIDPLFRFRFAQREDRKELVAAHLEYWGSEQAMAEGSPQTVVEEDEGIELPPILMVLKENDGNHPLEMQERFIASYRARGGPIEVETFVGLSEHRMRPSPDQPETIRAIDTMVSFARRHTPGVSAALT